MTIVCYYDSAEVMGAEISGLDVSIEINIPIGENSRRPKGQIKDIQAFDESARLRGLNHVAGTSGGSSAHLGDLNLRTSFELSIPFLSSSI